MHDLKKDVIDLSNKASDFDVACNFHWNQFTKSTNNVI